MRCWLDSESSAKCLFFDRYATLNERYATYAYSTVTLKVPVTCLLFKLLLCGCLEDGAAVEKHAVALRTHCWDASLLRERFNRTFGAIFLLPLSLENPSRKLRRPVVIAKSVFIFCKLVTAAQPHCLFDIDLLGTFKLFLIYSIQYKIGLCQISSVKAIGKRLAWLSHRKKKENG